MIFFNRHLKIGKEIGKATRKSIILPFVVYGKDQNFVPPPEFLTDMYIYGYITASISNLMDYAFGGKNWNHQKKGECIMEALKVVDPTEFLLMFHVENVEGTEKILKLNENKEFKRGINDLTTIFGVAYGLLKPDDPDPILKSARKLAEGTKSLTSILGKSNDPKVNERSSLAGAVAALTLHVHIKNKWLKKL